MANDTESVDLFTALDQTCPYWQALSSGICLIKYSLSQKLSLLGHSETAPTTLNFMRIS